MSGRSLHSVGKNSNWLSTRSYFIQVHGWIEGMSWCFCRLSRLKHSHGKMCVCVYIWTCLETSSSMTIYIYIRMYTLVLCDQDGNSPPRDVWKIDSISQPNWGSFAMSDLIISKVLNHFIHVPSSIEQCSTPHIVPFYLLIENGIPILDCDNRHQNIGCITPLTNLQIMIDHREISHHVAGIDI